MAPSSSRSGARVAGAGIGWSDARLPRSKPVVHLNITGIGNARPE
jgi:hypothetical protein